MSGPRTCSKCATQMQDGQDWCLQCGQGAPKSGKIGPGWRSAAAALGSAIVLCLGAAAAAYAALKSSPARSGASAVAQAPPAGQAVPPASTTPPAEGGTTPGGQPAESTQPPAQELPETPAQPPKIPGKAATPAEGEEPFPFEEGEEGEVEEGGFPFGAAGEEGLGNHEGAGKGRGGKGKGKHHEGGQAGGKGPASREGALEEGEGGPAGEREGEGAEGGGGEGEGGGKAPQHMVPTRKVPLVLDTNAAHIYNPDHYPHELLGDPSLAIDGEVETAWTIEPQPEGQPKLNVGISINMHAPEKIAKVVLITATPGMKVQIYGTTRRHHLPASLKDKRWVKLSGVHMAAKRESAIYLNHHRRAFRQLLVWVVEQPTAKALQAVHSGRSTTTSTSTTSSALAGLSSTSSTATSSTSASYPPTTTTSSSTSQATTTAEPGQEAGISEIELYQPRLKAGRAG